MTSRNHRMNYASHKNAQYQGYSSYQGTPQQLGPLNSNGLGSGGGGGRDVGGRRGTEAMSRRSSGNPYSVVDGRVVSTRGGVGVPARGIQGLMPSPGNEGILNSHAQQIFSSGSRPLSYSEGGLLGPGGVHQLASAAIRGVPPSVLYEGYGLQQVQLADGSLRTVYASPDAVGRVSELGGVGGVPAELAGKGGMGGYRGYMSQAEEAKLALASASQSLPGGYQGRQIVRDGRLVHVGGYPREDEGPLLAPLSPRAMPMSPRRDDIMRMMSPRRDDLSPPMSPRRDAYDDIPRMMSPRREDLSPPPMSPRRRDYASMPMVGRIRRNLSPSREDELLHRSDFPMSPRRGPPITPPMSPRNEWGYDVRAISPPRMVAPMSPRHPSPAPQSPTWRLHAKAPSQWDVLPGKPSGWGGDRDVRVGDGRLGAAERLSGYGAEIEPSREDVKRFGQGWSMSRKGQVGDGRYVVLGEEQDGLFRPPPGGPAVAAGQGQWGRTNYGEQPLYSMANGRPFAYNLVVNQRVGMTTKSSERERAERAQKIAAERAAMEASRRAAKEASRPSRSERRDKDFTTRKTPKVDKNIGSAAKSSSGTGGNNLDRTGEKTNGSKSTTVGANAAGISPVGNGNSAQQAAAGTSSTPSNTLRVNEDSKGEAGKPAGDGLKKDAGANGNTHQNGVSSPANGSSQSSLKTGSKPGEQREAPKRPSLVMEIERAKKARLLAEQQRHIREVEETYYDANELSVDFVSKVNRAGSRYTRMINDDPSLRRRYQDGQGGLHCLVCGKGSKTFSTIYDLVTHAQLSQVQSKRIEHMGFRKALIDILKLNTRDTPVSNIEKEEDMILWPPVVVVENTRTSLGADRRWEGVTNSDMAVLLHDLGHSHGRAKSIWDKFGHKGIVLVEFEPSIPGLQEAQRLHDYFLQSNRGREQWNSIRPLGPGLPGESLPEGPNFVRYDEETRTHKRVFYGYLALQKDTERILSKKQKKKAQVVNRKEVELKLQARQSGEQVVI